MLTVIVILVVSGALVFGALWGAYGYLPDSLEGFIIAMAGGALIVAVVLELVKPAIEQTSMLSAFALVMIGAIAFILVDCFIEKKVGSESGGGLLAAVTLDGIPENLALGVALIGAEPLQVAALSGSIFLSNLPEAAGGAKEMSKNMQSRGKVLALWSVTAVLLSFAALAGNMLLADVPEDYLLLISCFAGGAVVASLATEVFPKAYKKDSYWAGVATAIGLIMALYLDQLA